MYFQHACKRYQVYSLDPTSDLFIGVFGVHLLPGLVVLSRFQGAKFETYDNDFIPKVETFICQKIAKTGNCLATFGLLAKMRTFVCKIAETGPPLHPQLANLIFYE